MGDSAITPGERRELRSVVRGQFKVLRAEVKCREAELRAEVEYSTCPDGGCRAEPAPPPAAYVYVASSWRNPLQPRVCAALRQSGVDHYDFRNPPGGSGFSWLDVDPAPDGDRSVRPKGEDLVPMWRYLQMLDHPVARAGFESDFAAMQRATAVALILPCGRSAHLELGWAVGAGKRTAVLLEDPAEPELMYRMVDYLATSIADLMTWLDVG